MALFVLIILCVLLTSIMSGVLGMAGGMVLMAVLITSLSVASAMLLHGVIQATSNGSRAWFLRTHISWQIMPIYFLGSMLSLALFSIFTFVPEPGIVLILVGAFAWLARMSKRLGGLDITQPKTTLSSGFVVTTAQLLAGASGPLLDVFYLNSPMSRQAIVANKALTQTLGHLLKILYYGLILGALGTDLIDGIEQTSPMVPWWVFVGGIVMATLGARIGTQLLTYWNDAGFQKVSQFIILGIATYCIIQGVYLLIAG